MGWTIHQGDVLEQLRAMPAESVQMVCTSPPYWGLRNYGVDGAGGLEATLEEHLAWIVEVFSEVRRVLRDDGVCWVNYGDAYSQGAGKRQNNPFNGSQSHIRPQRSADEDLCEQVHGLAAKQRLLLPARVALALQDDGWWIRSEIVWAKGVSFCPTYSGSCMPSSVRDRPTDSHEMVYLLSKRATYFYDADSVREEAKYGRRDTRGEWRGGAYVNQNGAQDNATGNGGTNSVGGKGDDPSAGRNLRTVWTINPRGFPGAHFATFPEALVRPCILAGTSERGACSECGAPWGRVVSLKGGSTENRNIPSKIGKEHDTRPRGADLSTVKFHEHITTGWEPTCKCCCLGMACVDDTTCKPYPTVPCVVLDPFSGSGTSGVVALRLGRRYVGIELNPDYVTMSENRLRNALSPDSRPLNVSEGQGDLFDSIAKGG